MVSAKSGDPDDVPKRICSPTRVVIFRHGNSRPSDMISMKLAEFEPEMHYASERKYREFLNSMKMLMGKWFGLPLTIVQYEDMMLVMSGYYEEMIEDIRSTIREMRRGDINGKRA